jgi:hypothetical protein
MISPWEAMVSPGKFNAGWDTAQGLREALSVVDNAQSSPF